MSLLLLSLMLAPTVLTPHKYTYMARRAPAKPLSPSHGQSSPADDHVRKIQDPSHVLDPSDALMADWALAEDWALMDDAASFTVTLTSSCNDERVTFWTLLGFNNPHLRRRSPEELRARLLTLRAASRVGREPSVLRSARRLADGRWAGTLDGNFVTLSVVAEGHLAADSSAALSGDPSYLEAAGGRIFALDYAGTPVLNALAQQAAWEGAAGRLQSARAPGAAVGAAAAGRSAEDLLIGAMVATVLFVGAQLLTLGAAATAPIDEQVSRQELRVKDASAEVLQLEQRLSADQASLQDAFSTRLGELEPRLRASEQRLAELKRRALAQPQAARGRLP